MVFLTAPQSMCEGRETRANNVKESSKQEYGCWWWHVKEEGGDKTGLLGGARPLLCQLKYG
ncbi:hypothetical protein E2C01_039682 [Portunus trituberculatus]|uniref:Uncharacterized protein n=1 Tax=Portunus trituberculatus TaxID=210409 RepID=A0A5B7FKG2_PORTR|nr:hypothetical protein [Portunus trituberculatus]